MLDNNSVFFLYQYEDKTNAIGVNLKLINPGDLNKFSKYKNICIDYELGLESTIGICFNNVNNEVIDNYCSVMNAIYKFNPNCSVVDIFSMLENIFKINHNDGQNEYLGLFCELVFIKLLEIRNISILDFYNLSDDRFDFHFNDYQIDIKYINQNNNSFTTSYKQLKEISINPSKNYYIGVKLYKDSSCGINLEQLINSINNKNHSHLSKKITQINSLKFNNPSLFEDNRFIIDKAELILIDNDKLPIITIKQTNSIISASFNLHAYAMNENVHSFIERIINE